MTTVYGIKLAEISTDDEGYYFDNFRFTEELFKTREEAERQAEKQAKELLSEIVGDGLSSELSEDLAEEINNGINSYGSLRAEFDHYELVAKLNGSPIEIEFLVEHTDIFDCYIPRLFSIIELELPAGI